MSRTQNDRRLRLLTAAAIALPVISFGMLGVGLGIGFLLNRHLAEIDSAARSPDPSATPAAVAEPAPKPQAAAVLPEVPKPVADDPPPIGRTELPRVPIDKPSVYKWLRVQPAVVAVDRAPIGRLELRGVSDEQYFIFVIKVEVTDPAKRYEYRSWGEDRGPHGLSVATDDLGNTYSLVVSDRPAAIYGRKDFGTVQSDQPLVDVILFQKPVPAARRVDVDFEVDVPGEGRVVFRFAAAKDRWYTAGTLPLTLLIDIYVRRPELACEGRREESKSTPKPDEARRPDQPPPKPNVQLIPPPPPYSPPAGKLDVTENGLRVLLKSARVRRPLFAGPGGPVVSKGEYLKIDLALYGSKAVAGKRFDGWPTPPRLTDGKGRVLKHVAADPAGNEPAGRLRGAVLPASGRLTDELVFDPPAADAGPLTLELDAGFVAPGTRLRLEIPRHVYAD